ncbi:K01809 mannose-6-phosphate isomerase [Cyberlindnera jadinii]|uniref:Mannose-6-phosphate isomerase n=1 Tax=Cyberlindnera jadinii (strain ATCC 18201 / CBS 1600 / BCRC 20928 / JCM 3617 / NBRC 0987 / NRRL Y-1542) TaxID=983966 RepID=A0A0H5C746_CYBJN|nr:K01809 mannose-6-phosphate isomerase [Cyberlindnera jadinii]
MVEKVFRLDSGYQNYDWGKLGSSSAVAQFARNSNASVVVDESKPYAELWMGTHPKVPSKRLSDETSLREVIASDPKELLGDAIISKYSSTNELPFLFKVLSIRKVLSIQAHPDKSLAKVLHANDPKNYPDDNHKPEMAIAVTPFEGFCGFKPLEEIADELQKIPELINIVGEDVASKFVNGIVTDAKLGSQEDKTNRELLQAVFGKIMNASDDQIAKESESLVERAKSSPQLFNKPELPDLILRMNEQFPKDVGLFCGCLLLNHCQLNAGEAMFLQAKDPHAYISGDIIECMAASDNVVRAGFTPKFKDVKNLVEMLTYSYDDVEKQKMVAQTFERSSGDGESKLFNPPIEEFAVLQTTFNTSTGVRKFSGFEGPSILIVTKGKGLIKFQGKELDAEPGFNYFIAPNVEIELATNDKDFTSYRAFAEVE